MGRRHEGEENGGLIGNLHGGMRSAAPAAAALSLVRRLCSAHRMTLPGGGGRFSATTCAARIGVLRFRVQRSAMPPCRLPITVAFSSFSCCAPRRILAGDDVWRIDHLFRGKITKCDGLIDSSIQTLVAQANGTGTISSKKRRPLFARFRAESPAKARRRDGGVARITRRRRVNDTYRHPRNAASDRWCAPRGNRA